MPTTRRGREPDVAIRHATPADLEAVERLLRREGSVAARVRADAPDGEADELHLLAVARDRVVASARAVRLARHPEVADVTAPAGWYLMGIVVAAGYRRRGLAWRLTAERLDWLRERTDTVWYFTGVENHAALALHRAFGFEEETRDFRFPGVSFPRGAVLCRLDLSGSRDSSP